MDKILRPYLRSLEAQGSQILLPGLKGRYPIRLADVFIQPLLIEFSVKDVAGTKDRRNRKDDEKNKESSKAPELATQVFSRERQIVILGDSGQGKSTVVRDQGVALAAADGPLPLFVELGHKREWKDGQVGNFEWLKERIPNPYREELDKGAWVACCRAIREGRACILLDGLDELSNAAQREVAALIPSLEGNQVVLTARPNAYWRNPIAGFKAYTLAPLQDEQTEELANRFCHALAREYGRQEYQVELDKVLTAARGSAREVARTPLFLWLICLIAFSRESIPQRPAPLIGRCVEGLFKWNRDKRANVTGAEDTRGIQLLGKLSLESFSHPEGLVKNATIRKLPNDEQLLFEQLSTAFFREEAQEDYRFTFEFIREYCAATVVAADDNPFAVLKPRLHHPNWQGVVLYTAGMLEKKEASRLDLWSPATASVLVKIIGPLMRFLSPVLGLFPSVIAGAGKAVAREVEQAIQGPLERWQKASRQSTEFLIATTLKHHCRFSRRCYEGVLQRDLRLAARCLGVVEACADRTIVRLADRLIDRDVVWRAPQQDLIAARQECVKNPAVRKRWLDLARKKRGRLRIAAINALAPAATDPEVQELLLDVARNGKDRAQRSAVKALALAASACAVREQLIRLIPQDAETLWPDLLIHSVVSVLTENASPDPDVLRRLLERLQALQPLCHENAWRQDRKNTNEWLSRLNSVEASIETVKRALGRRDEGLAVKKRSTPPEETSETHEAILQNAERLDELVRAARDENPDVRKNAFASLTALAATKRPEVLGALLQLTRGLGWPTYALNALITFSVYGALVQSVTYVASKPILTPLHADWLLQHLWKPAVLRLLEPGLPTWQFIAILLTVMFALVKIEGLLARAFRGGRSADEMWDVVPALQAWKGEVSRQALSRVARLAKAGIYGSDLLLESFVALWEEQHRH